MIQRQFLCTRAGQYGASGRAEPAVVVQFGGRRAERGLAAGVRIVRVPLAEPHFDVVHLADAAVADEFRGAVEVLAAALPASGLPDALVAFHRIADGPPFRQGAGQRFLAVDIETGFRGGDGGDGVPMVRQRDAHSIEVLPGVHLLESRIRGAIGVSVRRIDHVLGLREVILVDVANRHDLDVFVGQEILEVAGALPAQAEGAHHHAPTGGGASRTLRRAPRNDGGPRKQCGGRAQKSSPVDSCGHIPSPFASARPKASLPPNYATRKLTKIAVGKRNGADTQGPRTNTDQRRLTRKEPCDRSGRNRRPKVEMKRMVTGGGVLRGARSLRISAYAHGFVRVPCPPQPRGRLKSSWTLGMSSGILMLWGHLGRHSLQTVHLSARASLAMKLM